MANASASAITNAGVEAFGDAPGESEALATRNAEAKVTLFIIDSPGCSKDLYQKCGEDSNAEIEDGATAGLPYRGPLASSLTAGQACGIMGATFERGDSGVRAGYHIVHM